MKQYKFNLFMRTRQGQEYNIGSKIIDAPDYDTALKTFNKMDLPFHHFAQVDEIN